LSIASYFAPTCAGLSSLTLETNYFLRSDEYWFYRGFAF